MDAADGQAAGAELPRTEGAGAEADTPNAFSSRPSPASSDSSAPLTAYEELEDGSLASEPTLLVVHAFGEDGEMSQAGLAIGDDLYYLNPVKVVDILKNGWGVSACVAFVGDTTHIGVLDITPGDEDEERYRRLTIGERAYVIELSEAVDAFSCAIVPSDARAERNQEMRG